MLKMYSSSDAARNLELKCTERGKFMSKNLYQFVNTVASGFYAGGLRPL
jgi:hypothetical protein